MYWFKSYGDFAEWVDFVYWWSCIGKGLRLQPAQQACLLVLYNKFRQACNNLSMFDKSQNLNAKEANFFTLEGRRNVHIVLQCCRTSNNGALQKHFSKFLSPKLFLEFLWSKNLLGKQMFNIVFLSVPF